MEKKKKNNIIIIGLIIIICLILLIIGKYLLTSKKYIQVDNSLTLSLCSENQNCSLNPIKYTKFKSSLNNKEFNSVIEEANKEVQERYDNSLNSEIKKGSECESSTLLKYGKYSEIDYTLFENRKYISFVYNFYDEDFCLDTSKNTKPVVVIYSKKAHKVISQKQLQKEQKITEKEIFKQIETATVSLNYHTGIYYSLNNIYKNSKPLYWLYFNSKGKLSIMYYQAIDDSYNTYTITN